MIAGNGVMDESYLTGEPFFINKAPGTEVISGAINGDASLTIKAARLAIDSRYAKIMQVMQESEQKRPRIRRLADQLGAWYTPLAILIALSAWSHERRTHPIPGGTGDRDTLSSAACYPCRYHWIHFSVRKPGNSYQKPDCFGTNHSMPNDDI